MLSRKTVDTFDNYPAKIAKNHVKMTHLRWEMAGAVGTDFMVFPNIRNCPAPCGNGYHRFGVFDSPESHHRSRRDARPCVSICCYSPFISSLYKANPFTVSRYFGGMDVQVATADGHLSDMVV